MLHVKEMAEALGIKPAQLYYGVKSGQIPAPTHLVKGELRAYYSEADVAKIKGLFAAGKVSFSAGAVGLLTVKAVCARLGFIRQTWVQMHEAGLLAGIGHKIGQVWRYVEADVPKLQAALSKFQGERRERVDYGKKDRADQGLYSQQTAAEALGVSRVGFLYHLHRGRIPRPTRPYHSYLCYNDADLEELRTYFKKHYRRWAKYEG